MLAKDADFGHCNWVSLARELRVRYEIQQSDTHLIIKTKVIKHFQSEVVHRVNEHISENKKLYLYASINTIYKFESYLDYIEDFTIRSTSAKRRQNS